MLTDQLARVVGQRLPGTSELLTPDALAFLTRLEQTFGRQRRDLLDRRRLRQSAIDAGEPIDFSSATATVRSGSWKVGSIPDDLQLRRVEITGPTDGKMIINALNSGAQVFMADFEDANCPTWSNMVQGQVNLQRAIRRTIEFTSPEGKAYRLNDRVATLMVRPRGWHLGERHVQLDGTPISASLFDFGLYFFHNARELLERDTGPYFYLPKLESHLEARLWNEVFNMAEDELGLKRGMIKATVLIETIHAAFEMDEILYELRDHIVGLNAGRWDYIFSIIKTFNRTMPAPLPDRAQVTMTVPFMRAYTELLVQTCHKRGAHAIGGMAAFIPSRRDAQVNAVALEKVREDKQRECADGFDGTWVAHPDLVPVAMEVFDQALGDRPHQKHNLRSDVKVTAKDLLNFNVPGGRITDAGLRNNISVGLQYLEAWLRGFGAVAINNLMEDTATAEISRAQVWQWLQRQAKTEDDGRMITAERCRAVLHEELKRFSQQYGNAAVNASRFDDAAEIMDQLMTGNEFPPFLTLIAQDRLEQIADAAAVK